MLNLVYRLISLLPPGVRKTLRSLAIHLGVETRAPEDSVGGRREFLEKVIPKNGIGAELGVYKGKFSSVLIEVTQPQRLHLVDPWYMNGSDWEWASGDRSTMNALVKILKQFEKHFVDGSVVLHIGDDLEIMGSIEDSYFDWVYIDTTHAYDHTKKELNKLAQLIKPDGIICGDDWIEDENHRHHGVTKAVQEFCATSDFNIIYSDNIDRQWAIKRM